MLVVILLTGTNPVNAQDNKDWFPLSAEDDFSPSVIDMSGWLDKPAGKHGFSQMKGDHFVFEDGTPVKFWGVNIADYRVYVDKQTSEKWADYLAKYGVNAVRFHKWTWSGYSHLDTSTYIQPDMLEKLDYFDSRLKEKGIYFSWSHIYGHRPQPGDSAKMLAYNEVRNAGSSFLKGSTIGLVNFAPDLQDLSIELTVNLLNHVNPYTGKKYADEPALAYIELQNEDDIFFPTTEKWVEQCPTYKKLFCNQFSDWLKKKYGNQENLEKAWGKDGLNAFPEFQTNESLEAGNIYPVSNQWFFSNEGLEAKKNVRQRIYDTGRFLYECQHNFYSRFIEAIRATGYKGEIVGSCWQAGDNLSHYYNLYADYQAGFVDRHNYFGGGAGGNNIKPGKINRKNTAMVSHPGSGLLGTGMQMVKDAPFSMSEWMSELPNEWTAEASPIIGIYGFGLQGWDASFAYACNSQGLTKDLEAPNHGVFNTDTPLQMGLYPVITRLIYRGDVEEGKPVSVRNVNIPSLEEGKLGFTDIVKQNKDVKSFAGFVPPEALAAGKVEVAFTPEFEPTKKPDLTPWVNESQKTITSTTGQLVWDYSGKGFFTINTPGTKGVVGFAGGKALDLGDMTLTVDNPFAIVLVTSLEKDKDISQAHRLLVTTIARARNTGMTYNADETELLSTGTAPLLMEPVSVTLSLKHTGKPKITVLDHVGRLTNKTIKPEGNMIHIDGKTTRAFYYLIEY